MWKRGVPCNHVCVKEELFEAAAKRYLSAVTQKETRAEEEKLIYARVSKEQVEYF